MQVRNTTNVPLRNSCFRPVLRGLSVARQVATCRPGTLLREGITALEVLVAISVVALLAAISVPAVQNARETARRTQCQSQLREVLRSLLAYEASHKRLPRRFPEEVLPFLSIPPGASSSTVQACPSDPEATGDWTKSRASYRINDGTVSGRKDGLRPRSGESGIELADIKDGLSHTAAIAERLAWPPIHGAIVYWDDYPQWWNRRLRDTAVHHAELDDFADECEHRALKPLSAWISIGAFYNHVLPPNRNSCINERTTDPFGYRAVTASSLHTGGINFGLADGSVRFLSDQVDRGVWRGLATRSGSELPVAY